MLPAASLPMPATWQDLLEELAPVFSRRSTHRLFVSLACGMILADRSTVVAMAAAAGMAEKWRRACWFFSGAVWDIDALGVAVARLIVKYLVADGEPLAVAVDGTFFRRWGRKVAQARWAYDGAAQGGKKVAFGNTWVVAAIVVRLWFCPSPVALPVLFRLWHGKGTPSQVALAAEMMSLLVAAFPGRDVHGVGDAAFHGEPLAVQGATWTTRLPASAVLHGPKPPPTGKRGETPEKAGAEALALQVVGHRERDLRVPGAIREAFPPRDSHDGSGHLRDDGVALVVVHLREVFGLSRVLAGHGEETEIQTLRRQAVVEREKPGAIVGPDRTQAHRRAVVEDDVFFVPGGISPARVRLASGVFPNRSNHTPSRRGWLS